MSKGNRKSSSGREDPRPSAPAEPWNTVSVIRTPPARKEPFSALLNDGSSVMESGSIPAKFFFDDETIALRPTHVLMMQYTAEERAKDDYFIRGRRTLFALADNFHMIHFSMSGSHTLDFLLLVVNDYEKLEAIRTVSFSQSNGKYDTSLSNDILRYTSSYPVYSAWDKRKCFEKTALHWYTHEVVVPKQLFSPEPETALGRAMWRYVNWLHHDKAKNSCDFGERALLAVPKFFCVGIPFFMLKYLSVNILLSVVSLVLGILLPFFGFRPKPILAAMWSSLVHSWDGERPWCRFRGDDGDPFSHYRMWKDGDLEERRYVPITPFELALVSLPFWPIWFVPFPEETDPAIAWIVLLSIASLFSCAMLVTILARMNNGLGQWLRNLRASREERARIRQVRQAVKEGIAQEEWRLFLRDNMSVERRPDRIDLAADALPRFDRYELATKARTWFWATKIKRCRPFEQR